VASAETFLVRIDLDGSPFMRTFVEAESDEQALALAQANLDADPESRDEVAAHADALQPILDRVIERVAEGANYSLSFKHESGTVGPVVITDQDAARAEAERQNAVREDGSVVLRVPFGTTPDYTTPLPWMKRSEARRLAKYLGVPYGES
jgi:hypothetical protein